MGWALHFIQWGAFLALLLALLEILEHPRHNRHLVALAVAVASVQSRYGLYLEQGFAENTETTLFFVTSLFLIGPLLWSVMRSAVDFAFEHKAPATGWQFIAAGAVALFETWFLFQPPAVKQEALVNSLGGFNFEPYNILMLAGTLHMLVYFILTVTMFLKVRSQFSLKYPRQVFAVIVLPLVATLLVSLGFRLEINGLFITGCSLITITMLVVIVFRARNRTFFQSLKAEAEKKKYEKTRLTGLDLAQVEKQLARLMADELYLEEDLRLAEVAGRLGVTSNQLSRILNEKFKQNFNEFISTYRIEHAKRLLLQHKDRGVLTIAYESGFNNKVSFNKHFTRITGKTPSAYRRQKQAD